MIFSNTLINWYLHNKRDLPWRKTVNPYYIWLSEIILQQTRVDQGKDYYFKFVERYPTVYDLAKATEIDILNLWQGLGYYSRARNLHYSANYIVNQLNGNFPSTYNDIIKLKGVGDYTASAIASICFGEVTAVVDGNVYRVLARFFGVSIAINSSEGKKYFKNLAQELIDSDKPAAHNQAIMEFGARMCKPQKPNCEKCPLNDKCVALQQNLVSSLPYKDKKAKIKKRYFNYLVPITPDFYTLLIKREGKGIWQNLYEFPIIVSDSTIDEDAVLNHPIFKKLFTQKRLSIQLFNKQEIVHKLSHQHLYTRFWIVKLPKCDKFTTKWNCISDFPVPILIHKFVEDLEQTDFFSTFELK